MPNFLRKKIDSAAQLEAAQKEQAAGRGGPGPDAHYRASRRDTGAKSQPMKKKKGVDFDDSADPLNPLSWTPRALLSTVTKKYKRATGQ